jgi:hypothetical protein
VHSACARFAAGRIFFLGFGGFWVHEPGCIVKAELPLPRLCLGDVPHGAHKDEERRLERGSLKQRRKQEANPRAKHRPAGPATRTNQRVAKDQQLNALECDGMRWNLKDRSGMQWNAVDCDGMRWNAMECDGVRWNTLECNGTQWNAVKYSGMHGMQ